MLKLGRDDFHVVPIQNFFLAPLRGEGNRQRGPLLSGSYANGVAHTIPAMLLQLTARFAAIDRN